jgi:hypothetical protein
LGYCATTGAFDRTHDSIAPQAFTTPITMSMSISLDHSQVSSSFSDGMHRPFLLTCGNWHLVLDNPMQSLPFCHVRNINAAYCLLDYLAATDFVFSTVEIRAAPSANPSFGFARRMTL